MVRNNINEGQKVTQHIYMEAMFVDHLTKGLASNLFNRHVIGMGILGSFDLLSSGNNVCMPLWLDPFGYACIYICHIFYSENSYVYG